MSERLRIVSLIAVALCVYANTLWNGFAYDDSAYIFRNPAVLAPSLSTLFQPTRFNNVFRPVTFVTLAINWKLSGNHPFAFHLFNVLLHAAVTVLLYLVLRKLLDSRMDAAIIAFVAALLFAVHPIHTEVVASITGRSELLAAAFLLLAWLLHLQDRQLPALFCLLLAMMSKESAVVFLPLIVLGDLAGGQLKPALRYVWITVTIAGYLAIFWIIEGGRFGEKRFAFVDNPLAYLPASLRIPNALRIAWKYLYLQLLPYNLSSDYSYNAIVLYSDWRHLLLPVIVSIAVLAFLLRAFWTGRRHWFLAGAIYLAAFAASANVFVPTGTIMGERLAYLPSAGFCLLIALVWALVAKHKRVLGWSVLAVLVVALGARAAIRNRDWRDDFSLFSMDVHTVPNSARVHVNLGVEYMQRNQLDAALAEFDRGLQIYPTFPSALENHALLDSRLRRDLEALRMFRQALSVVSADNVDYNFMRVNLAAQLTKMAQYDEALDLLNQTIAQTPDYSRAWSNRAVIRLRRGDFKSARADAQTALRLDSTNAQAESLLNSLQPASMLSPDNHTGAPPAQTP